MTEPTFAFVDRRDPADPDQPERFRDERTRRRVSLWTVASATGLTVALVSSVERRTYAPCEEEWQALWQAIRGA